MKLLVSVRSAGEALAAAGAGADFIDCKEPSAGALGALPLVTVQAVVEALRAARTGRPISATVGDVAPGALQAVLERAAATAACGVDYVKVGIAPGDAALLDALAQCRFAVVPVFIADDGLDGALLERALALPFAALMLDTADKARGSLFDVLSEASLRGFVERVQSAGKLCGLSGALGTRHLPQLARLGSDFAGFRSAVCEGSRTGALDAERVRRLRDDLRAATTPPLARAL
ncbi:(5-formylfuran-3-yl)methyl phosphate synthase [Methylibium sp.]|uniref:(5-formylfuran-3-yl)methyl phosphate synthase n=1 Tax=Methylibium sp. TaxID=2067992 RepID=UPI00286B9345|nr:(5-formylfuran-3-yl)methyl phosphate synthase [Methylibium sp.]